MNPIALRQSPLLLVLAASVVHCTGSTRGGDDGHVAACAGLSGASWQDQLQGVRAGIESVRPKEVSAYGEKHVPAQRLAGAVIQVRASPGMTEQSLTLLLRCRGAEVCSTTSECPFTIPGVEIRAAALPAGFAVSVESHDAAKAREILRRSLALRTPPVDE